MLVESVAGDTDAAGAAVVVVVVANSVDVVVGATVDVVVVGASVDVVVVGHLDVAGGKEYADFVTAEVTKMGGSTFDKIRQVGMSILASAGILGIIIGFAAQRSLATLIAGLQIALTQPIRLDDAVIVEGEWGVIEEITLTYVVVRVWDLRRLVVPVTYFLEKPFQNWTRLSANLLGTVFLYVDYMLPVDELRQALHDILHSSDNWDGQVWGLQVTNAGERTIELRALMSAADAPTTWNLRCEVREKLLAFLRENHPDYLPRVRAELERAVAR